MHQRSIDIRRQHGDRLFTSIVWIQFAVVSAVCGLHGAWGLGLVGGGLAAAVATLAVRLAPGTFWSRAVMAAAVVTFSGILIQATKGQVEFHFGIFVMLALLIYYRDWRLFAVATGVVAVHHLAGDLLQRAGYPVYVFEHHGGLGMVVLHAAFVLVEAGFLSWISVRAVQDMDRADATQAAGEAVLQNTRVLADLLDAMGHATTPDETLQKAVAIVRERLGWAWGAWWRVEKTAAGKVLRLAAHSGAPEFAAVSGRVSIPSGSGVNGRVQASGELAVVPDLRVVEDDPRRDAARQAGLGTAVSLPLFASGKVVGTLEFAAAGPVELAEDRRKMFQGASQIVSDTIERLGTQEQQQRGYRELQDKVDAILAAVTAAEAGDLTHTVPVRGEDPIGRLGERLDGFLGDLRTRIAAIGAHARSAAADTQGVAASTAELGRAAAENGSQATVVSAAAEQVSRNVQTVATATEEMSASVREIAKSVHDATRVVSEAVQALDATSATVARLGRSSEEIGDVVKLITSVAEQTNLLALNATIEAARAGAAGKGFAVVAHEVKELARQTAQATGEIGRKIQAIQGDTRSAVEAIGGIGTVVRRIDEIQQTIASAVEEQSATTAEMARNVHEAAAGSHEIAENIAGIAGTARHSSEAVQATQDRLHGLAGLAAELQELVDRFRTGADARSGPAPAPAPVAGPGRAARRREVVAA